MLALISVLDLTMAPHWLESMATQLLGVNIEAVRLLRSSRSYLALGKLIQTGR